MFSGLFRGRSQPAATRTTKIQDAIAHLDTQIASYEETAAMQTNMAAAYRARAAAVVGTDRNSAARFMRRAAACNAQVAAIETVISSTAGQRQALEMTAVHSATANSAEITRSALSSAPVNVARLTESLDDVQDHIETIQSTQDVFASMADGAVAETDDELLAQLETQMPQHTTTTTTATATAAALPQQVLPAPTPGPRVATVEFNSTVGIPPAAAAAAAAAAGNNNNNNNGGPAAGAAACAVSLDAFELAPSPPTHTPVLDPVKHATINNNSLVSLMAFSAE